MRPTEELMKELELLFEFVPPEKLKSRIDFLLMEYLKKTPKEDLCEDFQEMVEDIHFMKNFLERAGE